MSVISASTRALLRLAKSLGIDAESLGPVSDSELIRLFDGSSGIFYLSSEEGLGLPVLEAMYRGVSCVTSDSPQNRELAELGIPVISEFRPRDYLNTGTLISRMLNISTTTYNDRPEPDLISMGDWVRILFQQR